MIKRWSAGLMIVLLWMASTALADGLVIEDGQRFCLVDQYDQTYEGCTATKFAQEFHYQAECPDKRDPTRPPAEIPITDSWTVVFYGKDGCPPKVTDRAEVAFYDIPRGGTPNDVPAPSRTVRPVIRVLYGTNRGATFDGDQVRYVDGTDGELRLGVIAYSAPIEWLPEAEPLPWQMHMQTVRMHSPDRADESDFVVQWMTEISEAILAAQLGALDRPPERAIEAFVFVPDGGLDVAVAASLAARLARDMRFPGMPIVYGWSREGEDHDGVTVTARRLTELFQLVRELSAVERIHLVAQGSGASVAIAALRQAAAGISDDTPSDPTELVLIGPDIDPDVEQALVEVSNLIDSPTMYLFNEAGVHDAASTSLEQLSPALLDAVEVIEVVEVEYDPFESILEDMTFRVVDGLPAERRPSLTRAGGSVRRWWRLTSE